MKITALKCRRPRTAVLNRADDCASARYSVFLLTRDHQMWRKSKWNRSLEKGWWRKVKKKRVSSILCLSHFLRFLFLFRFLCLFFESPYFLTRFIHGQNSQTPLLTFNPNSTSIWSLRSTWTWVLWGFLGWGVNFYTQTYTTALWDIIYRIPNRFKSSILVETCEIRCAGAGKGKFRASPKFEGPSESLKKFFNNN